MNFIVGIDVAKRNHEAVIMDEEGTVVQKSFSFANSCIGYNKLLDFVRRVTRDRAAVSFGMESTGHYWLPLYTRLIKEGYRVHVINPIQSDALRIRSSLPMSFASVAFRKRRFHRRSFRP